MVNKFNFCFFLSGLLFIVCSFNAHSKPIFPPTEFENAQPVLCSQDENLEYCHYENFNIKPIDLNGDRMPEWIFYAGHERTGESGIVSFSLIKYSLQGWRLILDGASNYGSPHLLKQSHLGYRDFEMMDVNYIRSTAIKTRYRWSGNNYQAYETTYFFVLNLYNSKHPIFKKVSMQRYEACEGEERQGCPEESF